MLFQMEVYALHLVSQIVDGEDDGEDHEADGDAENDHDNGLDGGHEASHSALGFGFIIDGYAAQNIVQLTGFFAHINHLGDEGRKLFIEADGLTQRNTFLDFIGGVGEGVFVDDTLDGFSGDFEAFNERDAGA